MAFSVGPLVVGSVFLMLYVWDRSEAKRREKRKAGKKEGDDWGDEFQSPR